MSSPRNPWQFDDQERDAEREDVSRMENVPQSRVSIRSDYRTYRKAWTGTDGPIGNDAKCLVKNIYGFSSSFREVEYLGIWVARLRNEPENSTFFRARCVASQAPLCTLVRTRVQDAYCRWLRPLFAEVSAARRISGQPAGTIEVDRQ